MPDIEQGVSGSETASRRQVRPPTSSSSGSRDRPERGHVSDEFRPASEESLPRGRVRKAAEVMASASTVNL